MGQGNFCLSRQLPFLVLLFPDYAFPDFGFFLLFHL